MTREAPHSDPSPDTQPPRWSEEERQRLLELATGKPRKQTLLMAFPGRTIGAIKQHLFKARRELGIPKKALPQAYIVRKLPMLDPLDPGEDDGEFERRRALAEIANEQFLARLKAA